jgi:hypothetical protein
MTVQGSESIIYNGEEYSFYEFPLEPYISNKGIKFDAPHTGCWRGYYGTWLVEDNALYLIDLRAFIDINKPRCFPKFEKVALDYLFPNQDKVFAEWFSGKIHLPYGNMIPSYFRVYEKNIVLEFVSGKLVASHIEDNTHLYNEKKETDDLPF